MSQSKESNNPLLEQVYAYWRRGWSIIPIRYPGKKPALNSWKPYQNTRADEAKVRQWFSKAQLNVAVILGSVSGGLCCLDFDDMGFYEQWKHENNALADRLPTAQTSRGMHVYFRSNLTKTKKREKLDIKASGYCLLPPSLHSDKRTVYRWIIQPNGEIPKLSLSDLGIKNLTEETEDTEAIASLSSLSLPSSHSLQSSQSSPSSVKAINSKLVLWENLDMKNRDFVKRAIKCTLPSKKGYRNFLIFQFCRWLKGNPEFENHTAGQLKPLVKLWHERALPFIGTKIFDETWADFAYGWNKVKYPKGNGALKAAVDKALNAQQPIIAETIYEKAEIRLLVRVCYELQFLQQEEPFWVSWNDAAWILGVSSPTAGKWLCMLEADNVIQKVEEHTFKYAARYRWTHSESTE